MLSLLGRVIKSPWFWSLIGVIILCLFIWFLLGAIGIGGVYPFEDPLYRLAAILVVVVVYFIFVFVSLLRSQRTNKKMISELDAAGEAAVSSEDDEMTAQEVATLRERMHDAMRQLRKAKFGRGFGRRYLYELPWYVLIGAPGLGQDHGAGQLGPALPARPTSSAPRRCAASAARATATGGSPTRRC